MDVSSREERAFEALIVFAVRGLDDEDVDIEHLPDLSEKEDRALKQLGPDFMDELLAGNRGRMTMYCETCESTGYLLCRSCGGAGVQGDLMTGSTTWACHTCYGVGAVPCPHCVGSETKG